MSKKTSCHILASPPISKLKTYGCAIAIIVGIGALAAGATGLVGYFHVGTLSNMAQIDAMILMTAGGGGGLILLIFGVVGTVKVGQMSSHQHHVSMDMDSEPEYVDSGPKYKDVSCRARLFENWDESALKIDTQGGLFFGPEAWAIWNVKVLDTVPPAPKVDLREKDKVLIYIPKRIQFNNKERDFSLHVFRKIIGDLLNLKSFVFRNAFEIDADPGWVLIDRTAIPETLEKDYEAQKKILEKRGCSPPKVIEVTALNLMVLAFTGEQLYKRNPVASIRCVEVYPHQENCRVHAGRDYDNANFDIHILSHIGYEFVGIVGVRRDF